MSDFNDSEFEDETQSYNIVDLPVNLTPEDIQGFVKTVHKLTQLSNDGRVTLDCMSPLATIKIEDVESPSTKSGIDDINGKTITFDSSTTVRTSIIRKVDWWMAELGDIPRSVKRLTQLLQDLEKSK